MSGTKHGSILGGHPAELRRYLRAYVVMAVLVLPGVDGAPRHAGALAILAWSAIEIARAYWRADRLPRAIARARRDR